MYERKVVKGSSYIGGVTTAQRVVSIGFVGQVRLFCVRWARSRGLMVNEVRSLFRIPPLLLNRPLTCPIQLDQ